MAQSSQSVVNQAINLMGGNQPPVAGNAPNFDSSSVGQIAANIYADTVASVGRQFGWDFSRSFVKLELTDNGAPFGYAYEYLYPSGIQVWQLVPAPIEDPDNKAILDPNDPRPVNWSVGNVVVDGVQKKVIWTNLGSAGAVFNGMPSESTWDPLFTEAVVRLLASKFAMAIAGKPDTSDSLLQSGGAFESLGEKRDS